MFPERPLLDIVDETYRRKVHVRTAIIINLLGGGHLVGFGSTSHGTLEWHWVVVVDRARQLRRAKDIGHEGMIIKTPDAVGTCGFERISQDELTHYSKVSGNISFQADNNTKLTLTFQRPQARSRVRSGHPVVHP